MRSASRMAFRVVWLKLSARETSKGMRSSRIHFLRKILKAVEMLMPRSSKRASASFLRFLSMRMVILVVAVVIFCSLFSWIVAYLHIFCNRIVAFCTRNIDLNISMDF